MLNSHNISEALNAVYKCTICHHCSGNKQDQPRWCSMNCTLHILLPHHNKQA